MTKGWRLFGGKRSKYGDKPSDRGRFEIRMAKWGSKSK